MEGYTNFVIHKTLLISLVIDKCSLYIFANKFKYVSFIDMNKLHRNSH